MSEVPLYPTRATLFDSSRCTALLVYLQMPPTTLLIVAHCPPSLS